MSTINERVKKHRASKKDLGFKRISFEISAKDFKELSKFKKRNELTYSDALHELLMNLKFKPRKG